MLHEPYSFGGDAILTDIYLINRRPTSILSGILPYENVFHAQPQSLTGFWLLLFFLLSKIYLYIKEPGYKEREASQQPSPQKQRRELQIRGEIYYGNNKEHNSKKTHNKRLAYYKQNNKRTQYVRLANYKESSESINSQRCPDKQMTNRYNREPIFN